MASSNSIKPVLGGNVSKPFDIQNDVLIPFQFNGVPINNTYQILDPESLEVLYTSVTEESSEYRFIIAAGGLGGAISNGHNYLFKGKVSYNNNGAIVESSWSDTAMIYCYSMPSISLTNIPAQQGEQPIEINVPTITVGINYTTGTDPDIDDLNLFKYSIYNADKVLLKASESYKDKTQMYTFYGLDNNKIYYLRVVGTTVHGQTVDTGYVPILIRLGSAGSSSVFSVENNKCEGNILVSTNIDTQGYYKERDAIVYYNPDPASYPPGESYDTEHPDDPAHIWSGYFLNTLPNGYVCYTKGYYINGEFASKVTFGQPLSTDKVFYFKDTDNNEIVARYMLVKGLDNTTVTGAYFLLEVVNTTNASGVTLKKLINNYATDIFPALTNNDLVDLSVNREKVYYQEGRTEFYYSYTIKAKITTYNNNGEVVNEAWY